MNTRNLLVLIFAVTLSGCGNGSNYPVEKRFWTPEDYDAVIRHIRFVTPQGEEFPRFSNPETSIVIQKLVDQQNFEVILDDTELGLNHRNEVSQAFFDRYQDMERGYAVMDVQDKYVYAQELIEIHKFGLAVQLKYFKLGNDRILEESDSPDAARTKEIIASNEQALIKNYIIYLEHVSDEKRYGSHAPSLAEGLTKYFFKLLETYPKANYDAMLNKANLVAKKIQTPELKSALSSLITKLETLKQSKLDQAPTGSL